MMFAMPRLFWKAQFLSNASAGMNLSIQPHLINRQMKFNVSMKNVDHHTTHAVAACYTSPYKEAVCAIVDGMGEGTSISFYRYAQGNVTPLTGIKYKSTASLGTFYMILCELCGFDSLKGEEWKVMGLAPYGKYDERIARILKPLISTEGLTLKSSLTTRGLESIRRTSDQPSESAADLAFTGQKLFEECMFELLSNLYDLGISDNLVMGGGCCLNSSCNGKILDNTEFKSLHINSSPGDDGNARGAAWHLYKQDHPDFQPAIDKAYNPYLGTDLQTESLTNLKRFAGFEKTAVDEASIIKLTAQLIAEGKVIGWARGRAEFGPRALGNRSILADPRDPKMKDKINGRVKFREEFRPFAPSILDDYGAEYFEHYQFTPYMERTLKFKQAVRGKVPAVVHGDGTGRLQSVTRELNQDYYQLIDEFRQLTGVPLILNTSFNIMGKPIIHSVEDAIAVFYTTGLDVLVLEDVLIMKPGIESGQNAEVMSLKS
jgi:carbamoyltransferase